MSRCIVLFVTVLVLVSSGFASNKPSCASQLNNEKLIVICYNPVFTTLPKSLDPNTQILDLSYNRITVLGKEAFKKVKLMNLESLNMTDNGLHHIDEDAFRDVYTLTELDLSDNSLTNLEPDTFPRWLKKLNLRGNPLKQLGEFNFLTLPHLTDLDLQSCQIEVVHFKAFQHLTELQFLNIDSNNLHNLPKDVFKGLSKLKIIELANNPWRCDCHLQDFYRWVTSINLLLDLIKCAEPLKLKNAPLKLIRDVDQLTCPVN